MIAHLRGKLLHKTPQQAIVEAGGVGYDVMITVPTFSALPNDGAEVSLFIHTHVREDALALFGFTDATEKRVFEKLISISGIGPKLAMTILSGLSVDRLVGAIRAQDHAMLTKIPGVGKKTAERVTLELKDKLDDLAIATPGAGSVIGAVAEDVLSALVNLGYQRTAAQRAIETAVEREPAAKENFEALFRASMVAMR
jgi:Holliday junction DNA helicase RuvA